MIKLGLIPLMWLAAAAAPTPVQTAQALWDKGLYRQAVAAAFEAANMGDPQAQYILAEAYRQGRSVDPDELQARDWYLRAARQGDVPAAAGLGELLVHMRRSADAVPWLTLAASHGHPRATALLAAIYFTGDGADRDLPLATSLMKKAAALGSPEARMKLAMMDDTAPPVDVSSSPRLRPLAPSQEIAQSLPVAPAFADSSTNKRLSRYGPSARPDASKMVRFQAGAFRSQTNAQRACRLIAARIPGTASDLRIVPVRGYYKVLLLSAGPAHTTRLRLGLTEIGWQHFARHFGPKPA